MLLPDPLRNGYTIHTHHLRWSLSMGEEHPLILGAVVTRAQAVIGGVAVSTSTTWIHDRDEQLGAGERDVEGVKNGTYR